MRTLYTFSQVVQSLELNHEDARKAALVLRECGYPLTEQGYMWDESIALLLSNLPGAVAAYDKAHDQMAADERELENMGAIELPAESEITARTIARKASDGYAVIPPGQTDPSKS
jgi:hypothetical protein